jgi:hypothetical protein
MNSEAQGLQVDFCGGVQAPGLDLLLAQLGTSLCMIRSNGSEASSAARYAKTLARPRDERRDHVGRGIEKHPNGRRLPRLVYGLVYKGPSALSGDSPILRLSCKSLENRRADERTRTADLLITSDRSCVAGVCRGLQMPHF